MNTKKNMMFSKDFYFVAIGQIISLFGNQILRYALPLYLLNQTNSSALFGTISAIAFIPMILLCPIGGILADRVNKRNIMVILDFGTAAVTFLFCFLLGKSNIVPLVAATMIILYGIQGTYQPTVQASVPVLVDTEHMMQANSVITLISSLANMVGPVIGGMLYSVVGLTPILYTSVGCFCASAIMEMFIHIPFKKKEITTGIFTVGMNDVKESVAYIFHTRSILWKISLIFASLNLLLTALLIIGVPVIITQHLGFATNTANRLYGYAQGVIAAGSLLGGMLAGILSKRLTANASPFLLVGCALAVMLGGVGLQLSKNPLHMYIVLTISSGIFMLLASLFSVQMMTYLQLMTPQYLIGKVISCVMFLCMCSNPLGQLAYGFIFDKIGDILYVPFYIAPLIMIGISIMTRHIFCGVEQLIKQANKEVIPNAKDYAI